MERSFGNLEGLVVAPELGATRDVSGAAGTDLRFNDSHAVDAEEIAEGMGLGGDEDGRGGQRDENGSEQPVRRAKGVERGHSKAFPSEA
ncbi:MAG: hypothetical protein QE284_00570 [Rhizobium sp.]|nr:hypothetical protein [Rhizobium sp.]